MTSLLSVRYALIFIPVAQTVYTSKYNALFYVFVWDIEIVVLVSTNTINETEAHKTEFNFNQVIIPKEQIWKWSSNKPNFSVLLINTVP